MSKDKNVTIKEIVAAVEQYLGEDDVQAICDAHEFATEAHAEQFRKSGEPYIIHPIQVAYILTELEMDAPTIIAGLLHDVVEDTEITLEEIEEQFSEEVAMLVDGVTKLGKIKYKSKETIQAENHRKMFIAMAKDIRVILIKLADRLHNMRTLRHLPSDKQRRISNETLEIFAPLAHRLGMSQIKWELEDTSLRYLNPQQYYRIVTLMRQKRAERERFIDEAIEAIDHELTAVQIEADISGRPKHIYSTYRKMKNQNVQFNEIYDLLAVRVIVNSIKDCYAVLGIIHTYWKPMPGRFKDYIAMPKTNLYQSIHTTVIGPQGEPLEVQIRTKEMHKIAEYGIAAHWAYKEGKQVKGTDKELHKRLSWFREILDWQQETHDAEEFVESLKIDLFSDMVYVFTPKGDVIELPSGSVPIDFAYRIHTEIGNKTVGARVNGKMEPLDYELQNGDIVEVITSRHSYGPSQDWLNLTKSSQAKSKIRQFFKKQRKEKNIEKGREALKQEITDLGFKPADILTAENIGQTCKKYDFIDENEMFAAIGYQGISASLVAARLTEKLRKEQESERALSEKISEVQSAVQDRAKHTSLTKVDSGVVVKGIDNILIRLARCCNPVPYDEIIGFITKGRGVSVHREDCPNMKAETDEERFLEVAWKNAQYSMKDYHVDLEISGYDRHGLLNDVLQIVNETNVKITSVNGRADQNKIAHISLSVLIRNTEHLKHVVNRIKQVKDIYAVTRTLN